MKTTPVTPADLRASVIAVPPMPRNADGSAFIDGNKRLLDHMRSGGVTSYMYGGNANFYNLGVKEFDAVVGALSSLLSDDDWLIPSVGPDYGKAAEQLDLLRDHPLPTAMVLPLRFPSSPGGVATGLRKLAERYGKPLITYMKDEGYIAEADMAALVKDGCVCAIKYAIVRDNPREDHVLASLVDRLGTDLIISGIGERPVIDHFEVFGLRSFTSGSGCVAPALANRIREALLHGHNDIAEQARELFIPLEDARDAFSPIRVLHSAVAAAGIAETGPMGEFLAVIEEARLQQHIAEVAKNLFALEAQARQAMTHTVA
ncbi:dihydrodipicolinate synthase family protein [Cupriavidus sp. AcVe19-1a]|uniref:dihydrodipicolinate synthase family protein n=1 Tax=Cupriavidus sp. AcVe19-1a TaxID=2821359 RepID=UPI001AE41760|nr:dihydrodipicolinate synthase family protein [Cupriavidus sp. AcVe19-1a]MBP0633083.1 dihydrodipicolinate synthase family protein [Cupriavidus sp. AcVe19-1a]